MRVIQGFKRMQLTAQLDVWRFGLLKLTQFVFLATAFVPPRAFSRDPSYPSAYATATYHVDSSTRSERNLGTDADPFRSISDAVEKAVAVMSLQAVDVRILVRPGNDYREAIEIGPISLKDGTPSLTIEGVATSELPRILGSDQWIGTSFGKAKPNGANSVYFHPWSDSLFGQQVDYWAGDGFHLPEILRRRDSVRLGDFPLKQVLSYEELKPGSFFVNNTPSETGYGNYFVCPLLGTAMSEATRFEVAKRPFVLRIHKRNKVLLRNLVFESAADYFDGGVQIDLCEHVTIDNCEFSYCSSYGASVSESSDVTLTNCRFYKNGIKGLGGAYVKKLKVIGGNASFNNWRGLNGHFDEWDAAGIKFFQIHESTFRDLAIHDNLGNAMGLWLDTDVENVVVQNVDCQRNHFGLFYEASVGPCRLESCNLSNNAVGLYSSAADNLFVSDTTISNNDGEGQILVFGHSTEGGRKFTNFDTKQNHTVFGNHFEFIDNRIFWDRDDTFHPLVAARGNDIEAYRRFQKTFRGRKNAYWHRSHLRVFMSSASMHFIDFESWKKELGSQP
jgi:parallel beta-helix repeat protein